MAKLRSLSIKGFRAFGSKEQTLNLDAPMTIVWGPNSKGKTSLAEAFEFLLTGHISRRALLASSQDEFADALRNAHLQANEEVRVGATIVGDDGAEHQLNRILTRDYAKRQDCSSTFLVDGRVAEPDTLKALGIKLSQPPLEAPVLAQHTLGYIFSVGPQDRANYFKTLLEVDDLENLRSEISALSLELKPEDTPLLRAFAVCVRHPVLKKPLVSLQTRTMDNASVLKALDEAATGLITSTGQEVPSSISERLATIESMLEDRRSKVFPIREFGRKELEGWSAPTAEVWTHFETYRNEHGKIDENTRDLVALYDQALRIPTVSNASAPLLCPLCGIDSALTPDRVQFIRHRVEDSKSFKEAESDAKSALVQLAQLVESYQTGIRAAMPKYMRIGASQRRALGFRLSRLKEILGASIDPIVSEWLFKVGPLWRAANRALSAAAQARDLAKTQSSGLSTGIDVETLRKVFTDMWKIRERFVAASQEYTVAAKELGTALKSVLDSQLDVAGWQELLEIARHPSELCTALIERKARITVLAEFEEALKEIDSAKEMVLDDKFADYSFLIESWWQRLRPDEMTFFSAVQPRKKAKRTIDIKAGLSTTLERRSPKMRDVIAVFSQSQLHCLGLSLFLARAQYEKLGFIVLDDPVLSSDEDYRVHFNSTVLSELNRASIQVVVLTQDHASWAELETRYRHLGICTAQLFIDAPAEGTIIENTSDDLLAKVNRARSLARGGHPQSRIECGIHLRDAGERFCKEMLLRDLREKGDLTASLGSYDRKTLEWLVPRVEPLLDRDPSHPGKLEVFKDSVNHACHDNAPPSNDEMTHACGEIRFLVKDYLGR
jgi:hypothetical protein